MKKSSDIAVAILAAIVGYAAVTYGLKEYRKYNFDKEIDAAANEVKETINNTVAKDTSDRSDTEKTYDAAQDMMTERLKNVSSDNASSEDKAYAAGVFAGQYGRHVIVTYNYCNTLGVDVSEFSNGYKDMHKEVYKRAESILESGGTSIKEVYTAVERMTLPYVKKEIIDIQTMSINQTGNKAFTLADSCNYYNQVARDPASMSSIKFSIVAPEPFKVLMGNN